MLQLIPLFLILCVPAVIFHELGHLIIAKMCKHKIGSAVIGKLTINFRAFSVTLPVGVGFKITHVKHTLIDLFAGVIFESFIWILGGLFINGFFFLVAFVTVFANLFPFYPGGLKNDGNLILQEIHARIKKLPPSEC